MSKFVSLPTAVLADRLGVGQHRLHFEVVQEGTTKGSLVNFICLIDGKDLSPYQEEILRKFISEYTKTDVIVVRGKA
jgi:hypothetical protein